MDHEKPAPDMNDTDTNDNLSIPSHYVGIGASAGGLEAIESFFKNMPPFKKLAFIVVQHLSPNYKSLMMELLSQKTEMKVLRAEEGMQVKANCVYLIPPKKNLTIFHGKLLLSDQDYSKGLNLPIDIFFSSLAEDQGEKAIGIVLSGTGSDGTRGVRTIKEQGGMVMAQDEKTAKFDGMPKSAISTGLVDFILPPEDMPAQILSFVNHPYSSKSELSDTLLSDDDGLARIFSLLREKTKADFTYYKPNTVIRRIERRMAFNQMNSLRDYVKFMEAAPAEVATLYRELLIGVTSFFRDQQAFDLLAEKVLPEILKNNMNKEVRFWVSGCSTGEEPYSLAMLCRECMETLDRSFDIKIFATDIDSDAIMKASNGIYPESAATDISPKLLSKYFQSRNDSLQISRAIREMVVFAQHNLIKDPPFTNISLVSCRNLLIYFQPVMQTKALEMFNFSLNPGGVLFLGSSETTGEMSDYFDVMDSKWKIYKSKGNRRHGIVSLDLTPPFRARDVLPPDRQGKRFPNAFESERVFERFVSSLSDYLPVSLIVNEQMGLQYMFGEADGFFKVPTGRVVNDITKMAHPDLSIPLATGIQKALKKKEEVLFSNVRVKLGNEISLLRIRIKPLPDKKGHEELAAVFIEEIRKRDASAAEPDLLSYDADKETLVRLADLENELQFTRENLQATIEELETSNEELQATNEELLSSNEELQSTNEELQSVNEELHTVNSEFQRKIIELTELNNDIENLLEGARIATIFLDENLAVRKFTPEATRIYNINDNDIGRPFNHLKSRLVGGDPHSILKNIKRPDDAYEVEVHSEDGEWYLMRVLPYNIGRNMVSGVSLTFINTTALVLMKEELDSKFKLREISNKLAEIFMSTTPNEALKATLDYIVEAFECSSGCIGRVNKNGQMTCSAITPGVLSKLGTAYKDLSLEKVDWNAAFEKSSGEAIPSADGSVETMDIVWFPDQNVVVIPIVFSSTMLGKIALGKKDVPFTSDEVLNLTRMATNTAPMFKARMDLDRQFEEANKNKRETRRIITEWELTFDSVEDLIMVVDRDYKIVKMNAAMTERLGGAAQSFLENPCHSFLHCSDEPMKGCPHVDIMVDGKKRKKKIFIEALNAEFLMTYTALRDEDGNIVGCLHVAHDLAGCRTIENETAADNPEKCKNAESGADGKSTRKRTGSKKKS